MSRKVHQQEKPSQPINDTIPLIQNTEYEDLHKIRYFSLNEMSDQCYTDNDNFEDEEFENIEYLSVDFTKNT
jgi:hypothetical protein